MGRHRHHQLVGALRLVADFLHGRAQRPAQQRPVQAGLGAGAVLLPLAGVCIEPGLGLAHHVCQLQCLDADDPHLRVADNRVAGLVREVAQHVGLVLARVRQARPRLGLVLRALLASRIPLLMASCASALALDAVQHLLFWKVAFAVRACERVVLDVAVEPDRGRGQRRVVEQVDLIGKFVRVAQDVRTGVLVAEADEPVGADPAQGEHLRDAVGAVRLETQNAERELAVAAEVQQQLRGTGLAVGVFLERKHVGVEPHAGEVAAVAPARRSRQADQLALLGCAPAADALAQHLRGDVTEPRAQLGRLELSVGVVERRAGVFEGRVRVFAQHHAALRREQPVFADLAVVDEALATNPARQHHGLFRGRIGRETHAGLESTGHISSIAASLIFKQNNLLRTSGHAAFALQFHIVFVAYCNIELYLAKRLDVIAYRVIRSRPMTTERFTLPH